MKRPWLVVVGVLAACVAGAAGAGKGGGESVLPNFSEDEVAYQQRAFNDVIGCAIARNIIKTIFKGRKGEADVGPGALGIHCGQYKGVFEEQCSRVVPLITAGLDGKKSASRAQADAAVHKGGACKRDYAKEAKKKGKRRKAQAGGGRRGCSGGKCGVHTSIHDLVVEGSLTLRAETVKAMGKGGKYEGASIPPIVHFIFGMAPDFGSKPFALVHYLAVKSARDVMPQATIFLYYKYEADSSNRWWARAKKLCTPIKVDPVDTTGAWPIEHVAHRADLLRLQALRDLGGIYMDLDVVTLRPFDQLMASSYAFIMGQEGENGVYGLCNAVLMSAPNSTFVDLWIGHFSEAYDPHIWSLHSVKLPSILGHLYPKHLTQVRDTTFFYPLWDALDHMYAGHGDTFPENIAMHLWESLAHDKYISRLTPDYIRNVDNNFNNAVRRFLPGDA